MNLYGEKVMLRAMEPEDLEMLREMINDPEVERMVGGWSFPVSKQTQSQWYEKVANDQQNLRFVIEVQESGEAIGLITLTDINWKDGVGEEGVKLRTGAPKRKGYATDALMTLEWYVFEELRFHRLEARWLSHNEASKRLHVKCGMKHEGIRRSAIFKNNQYLDQYCAGIHRNEYFEVKKRLGWQGNCERRNLQ